MGTCQVCRGILVLVIVSTGVLSLAPVASATCAGCWYAPQTPAVVHLGAYQAVEASFNNPTDSIGTLIVYFVVEDSQGQTVDWSTATITVSAGANGTAYLVLFGLPPGGYKGTLFGTQPDGVAVTNTVSENFTL